MERSEGPVIMQRLFFMLAAKRLDKQGHRMIV